MSAVTRLFAPSTGNGIGDVCENDFDKDGVEDKEDVCPYDPLISRTDFRKHKIVILDPQTIQQGQPLWIVNKKVNSYSFFQ